MTDRSLERSRFLCADLSAVSQPRISSLDDILKNSEGKFSIFYANASWIHILKGRNLLAIDFFEILNQFFDQFVLQKGSIKDFASSEQIKTPSLVLISELNENLPEDFQSFIQTLRKNLHDGKYDQDRGFAQLQACCWDLVLERERYSGIVTGASKCREYLLWDDGGLTKESAWAANAEKRNRQAWIGAGWCCFSLRHYASAHNREKYPLPPEFNAWARQAHDALQESLKALTAFYARQNRSLFSRSRGDNYVHALCEFLPYRRTTDPSLPWLPSNGLGNRGGPMRWRGLLDDRLSMHKRHLLLDGWITLWPCRDGQWYLQPASLALLYWAAREAWMPHTDTPEVFLKNYRWSAGKEHWFGGFWQPEDEDAQA